MILIGPKGRAAGELGFRDVLASAVSISVNDLMSSFLLLGQSLCRSISSSSLTLPWEIGSKWRVL